MGGSNRPLCPFSNAKMWMAPFAIAALKKIDNEDAKFFAGQLESVAKFFGKK